MVAVPRLLRFSRSDLPTIGGIATGVLVLGIVWALPQTVLEAGVWRSGIAALVSAAHPPLGATARLLLAGFGAIGAAAVTWSALYLIFGPGGPLADTTILRGARAPSSPAQAKSGKLNQRRADRHPDAPPRPPMRAADLGTPLMEIAPVPPPVAPPPVEAPLPRDLGSRLATFDPAALPPIPREPVRPVGPLASWRARLVEGERLETFPLNPPVPTAKSSEPADPPSVDALLRRLEEKAARRSSTQARA